MSTHHMPSQRKISLKYLLSLLPNHGHTYAALKVFLVAMSCNIVGVTERVLTTATSVSNQNLGTFLGQLSQTAKTDAMVFALDNQQV